MDNRLDNRLDDRFWKNMKREINENGMGMKEVFLFVVGVVIVVGGLTHCRQRAAVSRRKLSQDEAVKCGKLSG